MTDLMVDVPKVCQYPGCTKAFGHEQDPLDWRHGEGMYSPTTVGRLIEALQTIDNKDLPVCVFDGMDMGLVKHLIIHETGYWDGSDFQNGLILEIQGR